MITFATTCGGRLDDLQRTLEQNLRACEVALQCAWEYVVLDWGCRQGTGAWLINFHETMSYSFLPCEKLRVMRTIDRNIKWHYSKSKNAAHKNSKGDVILNVDADNFLSASFLLDLERKIEAIGTSVPFVTMPKGRLERDDSGTIKGARAYAGAGGRIGIQRTAFDILHGYNEAMVGYGSDDIELLVRAHNAGFRILEIGNSAEDFKFIATPPDAHDPEDVAKALGENKENACFATRALKEGVSTVNKGIAWGDEAVEVFDPMIERFVSTKGLYNNG